MGVFFLSHDWNPMLRWTTVRSIILIFSFSSFFFRSVRFFSARRIERGTPKRPSKLGGNGQPKIPQLRHAWDRFELFLTLYPICALIYIYIYIYIYIRNMYFLSFSFTFFCMRLKKHQEKSAKNNAETLRKIANKST